MKFVLVVSPTGRCQAMAQMLAPFPPFWAVHCAMLEQSYSLQRLATVKRLADGAIQARLVWRRRVDGCCAVMTGRVDAGPQTPLLVALAGALAA